MIPPIVRRKTLNLPAKEDTAWTTRDAIDRICQFAEDSLKGGYDGHGHEELKEAARVARQALAETIG